MGAIAQAYSAGDLGTVYWYTADTTDPEFSPEGTFMGAWVASFGDVYYEDPAPPQLKADFDANGVVNFTDFLILAANFAAGGHGSETPRSTGDANQDGR